MKTNLKWVKPILTSILVAFIILKTDVSDAQNKKYGTLSYNKAVNVAGKQRMLGQKLAKAYVYLVNNPNDSKAKRDMLVSKLVFEKQNKILLDNATSIATKNKISAVNNIWNDYKEFFEKAPNLKDAKEIIKINSDLLMASNTVVTSIINDSKGASVSEEEVLESEGLAEDNVALKEMINVAGRQRMLAQRLALYYFSNTKGLKDKMTDKTLRQVVYAMDNAIETLIISEFNTSRIDEKLAIAMAKWESIKENTTQLYSQNIPKKEIYQLSDALTKAFNDVTTLYEKVKI